MSIRQIFLFMIGLIVLLLLGTLPLWWDEMAPSILGFPSFFVKEINAYIDAVKWLIDRIFN